VFPSSQASVQESRQVSGLRSRKKHRTRIAIQDAALELFAEQGFENTTVEQIAAHAEVSTATFFRYFKSKGDAVFGGESDERIALLPALAQAILERPSDEDDLTAIRQAVLSTWVPLLEPERLKRHFRAAETSPLLVGLSTNLTVKWQMTISEALAKRRGLAVPDHKCRVAATIALAILTETASSWVHNDIRGDLAEVLEHGYDLMGELCAEFCEAQVTTTRRSPTRLPRRKRRTAGDRCE
jgi:AcrR family transcriptional regulator